jgi:hypothetical protein
LDKPHILALAAETGFLLFKEQDPLKFIKGIAAVQCERKTFRLISLSTPISFRYTVPLSTFLLQLIFKMAVAAVAEDFWPPKVDFHRSLEDSFHFSG